jgi:hypothetical protein
MIGKVREDWDLRFAVQLPRQILKGTIEKQCVVILACTILFDHFVSLRSFLRFRYVLQIVILSRKVGGSSGNVYMHTVSNDSAPNGPS